MRLTQNDHPQRGRLGRIAEINVHIAKSKVWVDWGDGKPIRTLKKSIAKVIQANQYSDSSHDGRDSASNSSKIQSSSGEEESSTLNSTINTKGSEDTDHQSSGAHSTGSGSSMLFQSDGSIPNHESEISGDSDIVEAEFHQMGGPGRGRGGRGGRGAGRGRGGRHGERGRGGGRGGRGGGRIPLGPYTQPPPPSSLHAVLQRGCHSREPTYQEWIRRHSIETDLQTGYHVHDQPTRLKWSASGLFSRELGVPTRPKTFLEYFLLMFPIRELDDIVHWTNECLTRLRRGSATTKLEILQFFGIRLAIALNPIKMEGGVAAHWNAMTSDDAFYGVHVPFTDVESRFGMSFTRFKALSDCLRLDQFVEGAIGQDPYKPIRSFVEGFNERRVAVVIPGRDIVVDECMSTWKGIESIFSHESFIHITKLKRKPRGIGIESKCAADGSSCIMLQLEVQEGKDAPLRAFEPEHQPHTAVVMRLMNPWSGSGRLGIADAHFSSLSTCAALLNQGLWYIGIVKGCTKGYPVKFAEELEDSKPSVGSHTVITTTVRDNNNRDRTIMSVLYKLGKGNQLRKIIGSFSSSLPGSPQKIYRNKRVRSQEDGIWIKTRKVYTIQRPKIIEVGMKHFGAVDLHDRYRQGYLNMEDSWHTHRCWVRLFTTVLGICFTDAYLAYKWEGSNCIRTEDLDEREGRQSFFGFLNGLARQLIFNNSYFYQNPSLSMNLRPSSSQQEVSIPMCSLMALSSYSIIKQKYDLQNPQEKKRLASYQLKCSCCEHKAAYYCVVCSSPEKHKFVALCSPRTGRKCFQQHK